MTSEFTAKLCYPNPTKPVGIEYHLPEDALVTMEVFNEDGTSVKNVCNETPMNKGKQFLEFHTLGLQNGVYLLRMIANFGGEEHRMTKKIIVQADSELD
jgi:hypothetical protein